MKQYIFTPGPVPMSKAILKIGAEQVPYFRNSYFSNIVIECKELLLKVTHAPKGSEVIFMASSGSGAMESAVINLLDSSDKALVINGGGFGQRLVDICNLHNIPIKEKILKKSEDINLSDNLAEGVNSFIINAHETTIDRLYDLKKIGVFCKKHQLLNIVDGISTFVSDEINMKRDSIDALILSSNKGLALPPGLAIVVLSPKALQQVKHINSLYFGFQAYLDDIKRGQTPFTPTVSIIKQLHYRLKELDTQIIEKVNLKTKKLSLYFRKKIKYLPFDFYVNDMPYGMTTITPIDGKKASKIIEDFEKNYNIILTPSGGDLKEKVIRISHMGNMNKKYLKYLINRLYDYYGKELK